MLILLDQFLQICSKEVVINTQETLATRIFIASLFVLERNSNLLSFAEQNT